MQAPGGNPHHLNRATRDTRDLLPIMPLRYDVSLAQVSLDVVFVVAILSLRLRGRRLRLQAGWPG